MVHIFLLCEKKSQRENYSDDKTNLKIHCPVVSENRKKKKKTVNIAAEDESQTVIFTYLLISTANL